MFAKTEHKKHSYNDKTYYYRLVSAHSPALWPVILTCLCISIKAMPLTLTFNDTTPCNVSTSQTTPVCESNIRKVFAYTLGHQKTGGKKL